MVFNQKKFHAETEQVLFIITILRGAAFNWISPFLINYMRNKNAKGKVTTVCKKETQKYFHTIAGFGKGINQVFGDIEEERTAERGL
jgi:hypothetical protein